MAIPATFLAGLAARRVAHPTTPIARATRGHGAALLTPRPAAADVGVSTDGDGRAVLGYGEKKSLTYLATGSSTLDLFFDAVPGITAGSLESLLGAAWREDPQTTVRIAFQLGDPRKGKGDLRSFYIAMSWLYCHHYETFMLNLKHVPAFSFHGALLDLLVFAGQPGRLDAEMQQADAHKRHKEYIRSREGKAERRARREATHERLVEEFLAARPAGERAELRADVPRDTEKPWMPAQRWSSHAARDLFVDFVRSKHRREREEARRLRQAARSARAAAARQRLEEDGRYRRLFREISARFAEGLEREAAAVQAGHSIGGLVGKWAPSPGGRHDRWTGIVDGIVECLYPASQHKLADGTHEDYLSFMRDRYRRLLSTLRGAAEVPEHFVGGGFWHLVNYRRMASRCRHVHGHVFAKHDRERYEAYLEDARAGRVRGPAAGAVLPHELTAKAEEAVSHGDDQADQVALAEASLQWLSLVRDTKAAGRLPSAMSVCDVSGSMCGDPMDVAIAMSLLLSDVAEEPWRNRICTFSESPSFVSVPAATGSNLADRARLVQGMDWGMNTDLGKVFDQILSVARSLELPSERLPEVLFVFSDMEFDEACKGPFQTDLQSIRSKYAAAGYSMPQVVFWNLRPSRSHPARCREPGVAMLSGFSAGMLKSVLEFQIDNFTPVAQMLAALEPYVRLRVADADLPGDGEVGHRSSGAMTLPCAPAPPA